jgi:uncharacterized protein YprB with RNaseH-like and TPR domain
MTLAARLDRLKSGVAGTAARSYPPISAPGRQSGGSVSDPVRLAQALKGRRSDGEPVLTDRIEDLGVSAVTGVRLGELPEMVHHDVDDWVYLDTETTGLSSGTGNLAFMVGVARYSRGGGLRVRQYTLATFGDERAMLDSLTDWIGDAAALVSYNGRGFDLPLLLGRLRLHSVTHSLDKLVHLDLMYTVRRAYRSLWPDCRLQTAERERLGLKRVDDLPGAHAPDAWRAWLQTGSTDRLAGVLRHNYQDVVSLARLHAALVEDYSGRSRQSFDRLRVGRAWESMGCVEQAVELWSSPVARLDESTQLALANLYRRQGNWAQAEAVWMRLHYRGNRDAALALSKFHEHRRRDFGRAMSFAAAAGEAAQDKRRRRLHGKLSRSVTGSNLELPLGVSAQPSLSNSMK